MHADIEHLGRVQATRVAFRVQHVKAVAQVSEKVIALGKSLGRRKPHVVAVQRVGHDELLHHLAIGLLHRHPERKIVAIVVAVVFKTAIVGHQAAGVGAVASGVPAQRALARELLNDLHADAHVVAFGGFIHILIADPAPAVAGNLMPELPECGCQFRMPLQSHADAKHGERQAAALELAQDAPYARARSVLVDAFHAHVPRSEAGRVEHFA